MKKILALFVLTIGLTPAVFAECSITGGACTVDEIQEIQLPRSFPESERPISKNQSTTNNTIDEMKTPNFPSQGYDANCQFGLCLPGNMGIPE